MKKIIGLTLSIAVAVAIMIDGYIVFFRGNQQQSNQSTSSSTTATNSSASSHTATNSKYKDGTFTGKTVTTPHGVMQVSVVVKNGKMTDVKIIKYPDTDQKSKEINDQSLPTYKASAIKAQNANVQHVSGATETYDGFKGSLQDALNQAV